MTNPDQLHLYSMKVQAMTITLFVDPPSAGGPDADGRERLADDLAKRLLATITTFGRENPSVLVAVTP